MATLLELKGLFRDSDLQDKVLSALLIAVQDTLSGTPTVDEQKYAAQVFQHPLEEAPKALASVLAANHLLTEGQILGASDAAIMSAVEGVRDTLTVAWNARPVI